MPNKRLLVKYGLVLAFSAGLCAAGLAPVGAFGLFFPIGILAHANGASPWLWLFWLACAVATERWIMDGTGAGVTRRP